MPPIECVVEVARAVRAGDERDDWTPAPTPEDVDDALRAMKNAREQLLADELALIEAARANDRSWDEIGKLLGVPVAAAKTRPATIRRAIADMNRL
ncbi:hypothetical protein [Nonomuraea sp. NPDC050202]|uniref:hypothetical protein n=1 Tax=Nonomuraea sp. NPDC050202 TaxID=3155035 RepID=UPI0033F1BA0A